MKNRSSGAVWGIMLILFGVLIGGRILNWFDFDIFFSGWWSLFLIIPSAVRFLSERGERISALKWLLVGVLLLMAAQGFIEYSMLFPLLVAGFLVLTGLKMLMPRGHSGAKRKGEDGWNGRNGRWDGRMDRGGNTGGNQRASWGKDGWDRRYEDAASYRYDDEYEYYEDIMPDDMFQEEASQEDAAGGPHRQGAGYHTGSGQFGWNEYANRGEYRKGSTSGRERSAGRGYGGYNADREWRRQSTGRNGRCACTAVFAGKVIRFSKEVFEGAALSAIFGGIELDLRDAVLYRDVTIDAAAVMGGITVFVPADVHVVVNSIPILGGVENHVKRNNPPAPNAITIYIKATSVMGGIEIK